MYCKNCGTYLDEKQEVCESCGVAAGKGNRYCGNCGSAASPEAEFCVNCGMRVRTIVVPNTAPAVGANPELKKKVEKRDLVKAIVFSLLTCGIYAIYWFIVMTDEVNTVTKNENAVSGGLAFLLSLITCGIYSLVWAYQMGEKIDKANDSKNSYSGIIYLVLMIFGLGIVSYALLQDSLNKLIDAQ